MIDPTKNWHAELFVKSDFSQSLLTVFLLSTQQLLLTTTTNDGAKTSVQTPRTVKTLIILWTAGQTEVKVHSITEFHESKGSF